MRQEVRERRMRKEGRVGDNVYTVYVFEILTEGNCAI